jgi:DNA modification methylase
MSEPYYQDDAVTIFHGDCRDVLPTLAPVGLILTDPPYGMAYQSNRRVATRQFSTHSSPHVCYSALRTRNYWRRRKWNVNRGMLPQAKQTGS